MKKFFKSKIFIGIAILCVLGIGARLLFHHSTTYQFITVQKGSITESVSLTGNTTPTQSVSLSFGSSGIISHVYSDLGKKVYKGQVMAELNINDLLAQLKEAQANVDAAQAKLQGLQAGSRPEDIAGAQAALIKQSKILQIFTQA